MIKSQTYVTYLKVIHIYHTVCQGIRCENTLFFFLKKNIEYIKLKNYSKRERVGWMIKCRAGTKVHVQEK